MKTATKDFPAYSTATDPTTGQTYIDTYDIFTVGAGYIDLQGALNSTDVAKDLQNRSVRLQAAMGTAVSRCTGCSSGSLNISSNTDRTRRYLWQSEQAQAPGSVAWPIKYSSCSRMTSHASAGSGTLGRLTLCGVAFIPSSSAWAAISPPPSSALIDAIRAQRGPFWTVNIGQR
jgi:hypothetical protein